MNVHRIYTHWFLSVLSLRNYLCCKYFLVIVYHYNIKIHIRMYKNVLSLLARLQLSCETLAFTRDHSFLPIINTDWLIIHYSQGILLSPLIISLWFMCRKWSPLVCAAAVFVTDGHSIIIRSLHVLTIWSFNYGKFNNR